MQHNLSDSFNLSLKDSKETVPMNQAERETRRRKADIGARANHAKRCQDLSVFRRVVIDILLVEKSLSGAGRYGA